MARGLDRDLVRAGRPPWDGPVQLQLFDTLPGPRSPLRLGRLLAELDRLLPALGRGFHRRPALTASSRGAVDAVSLLAIRRIRLSVERRGRARGRWPWGGLAGR
jgi:hypothetical protein